jgi:hypothetical protein
MMAGQGGGHHLCLPTPQRVIDTSQIVQRKAQLELQRTFLSNQTGINTTPAPI